MVDLGELDRCSIEQVEFHIVEFGELLTSRDE